MNTYYATIQVTDVELQASGTLSILADSMPEAYAQVAALHVGWCFGRKSFASINVIAISQKRPRGKIFPLTRAGFKELAG